MFGRRFALTRKRAIPMHIQAGSHAVAENSRALQVFKDGEGERQFEHVVKFEEPFEEVPQILVALSHLDVASHTALKLKVTAEKISATGFTLRYSTWAKSQIFGVGAQWMAFHAALSDFRLTGRIL
jgi:H-type lectin domain